MQDLSVNQSGPYLRYATLCSGIECISAAWLDLLLDPVFFAETDKFASAVLKHRFPGVPNLGDIRGINGRRWRGEIDVLWASTPCQSLSIAGKRRGLASAEGQLTLTFADLADALAPEFTVWENVKHALSVQAGAVFGELLGRLAGEDGPLVAPGGRWTHAGCVSGPARTVAWRVFDAQHGGVAQHRERVFLVGCPRNGADPRAILFESGEQRRDAPPKRENWSQAPGVLGESVALYLNADTRPKFEVDLTATQKADISSGCRASVLFRGILRRLTPLECERLQGLPDGWTDIPWGRGRAPDTLRRRAVGNGVAVPDARWIGERIAEEAHRQRRLRRA